MKELRNISITLKLNTQLRKITVNSRQVNSENSTTAFNWSQNGDTVTVTEAGVTASAAQNGNKLTLVIPSGFPIEVEQDGVIVELNENLTIEYTKQ